METNTLMVAAVVLDPATHYRHNFCSNPEYAQALTDAIEKMAETSEDAVQAIQEIGFFRECFGRFSRPTARAGASSMPPKFIGSIALINPIWDWLDKSMSDVGPSLDDIYVSRLDKSACGRNGKNKNRKRVRVEDEEEDIEFLDSEDGYEEDEFEDVLSDSDDDHAELSCDDDGIGDNGVETSPKVEGNIGTSREGDLNPNGRRSGRLHQKRMRLQTLYQRE
ncbi:hypothetical protein C2845_PM04G08600 [Panicum miliaceum]|uniref:Uncharacterized protein n=1 Tax=Panicum miliaceum TaxID=4540 RepID=A0A3L6QU60_PANMI|nr:hypothetical protein C2845_PM04G08600 [Panicum miliaceum]